MTSRTLLLSQSEISQLITLKEAMHAVEQVFVDYENDKILLCPIVHADVDKGEFHIKAGGYKRGDNFFTTKINGGFFSNALSHNLPNILGLILLNSLEMGFPLAIMESSILTAMRTAAATGVAIKYLAHPESKIATLCGCGKQAFWQLQALKERLPSIEKTFVFSKDFAKTTSFAKHMSEKLEIEIVPTDSLQSVLKQSQICITCTPSRKFIIGKDMLPSDIFIAAVGADSPDKQEIDPLIFENAKVVADIKEQAMAVGDVHHALKLNIVNPNHIMELGKIVSNGFQREEDLRGITIFDSTGTAMQDTALASVVYKKAVDNNIGTHFQFFG